MRYYVTADVHGFFEELKASLSEKGFFTDKEPHKLIICGDLYDRGAEALLLQDFILDLMAREEVILIRGNHEDLTLQLLLHGIEAAIFSIIITPTEQSTRYASSQNPRWMICFIVRRK